MHYSLLLLFVLFTITAKAQEGSDSDDCPNTNDSTWDCMSTSYQIGSIIVFLFVSIGIFLCCYVAFMDGDDRRRRYDELISTVKTPTTANV